MGNQRTRFLLLREIYREFLQQIYKAYQNYILVIDCEHDGLNKLKFWSVD